MSTGLLILRIVIGLLLVGHGTQKLFGWFGGHGIAGTGGWFESVGFRPGKAMAVVAGLGEAVGGLLLALGFLSPLAAAVIMGTLLVAASTHVANGLWGANGGYELPLLFVAAAATIAFTGAGSYSLDAVFGLDFSAAAYGIGAVALAVLGAAVVVLRASLARKADAGRELVTA